MQHQSITRILLPTISLAVLIFCSCAQIGSYSTGPWYQSTNITSAIDSSGTIELSGLYWNEDLKRLYVVADNGALNVLQITGKDKPVKKIGYIPNLGSPEGITQPNNKLNEIYTIDEKNYEIRRFSYNPDFSKCSLVHKWSLTADPGLMPDSGNDGPEGITFIPDSYLAKAGFVSSETDEEYISKKGMGGLLFIAHQKKGLIWVFDVNPDKDDDYAFVGRYKTRDDESCDLAFDKSTGLLYILHNTKINTIEICDLSVRHRSNKYKLQSIKTYSLPDSQGKLNIEGFALSPKNSKNNLGAWICRDVSDSEDILNKKNSLWWFKSFSAHR